MAVVHIVDDAAMAGDTIATHCSWRCMVGTRRMADRAISFRHDVRVMAIHASVSRVTITIAVCIRKRNMRTRRNEQAVEQMVAVGHAALVTNTTVSLLHISNQSVKHADALVDRWGGHISPAVADTKSCRGKDNN